MVTCRNDDGYAVRLWGRRSNRRYSRLSLIHICFKLESQGSSVILDPYSDGNVPGLAFLREEANMVLMSHNHNDHKDVYKRQEYSTHIHAAVEAGNVFACQFHPEKSSGVGLQILKNFVE